MSRLVVELPRQYLQCKSAMREWIFAEYQPQYINESIERLTRLCLSEVLERAIIDFIQAGYTDLDYIEEWEDEHIRDLVGAMFDSATLPTANSPRTIVLSCSISLVSASVQVTESTK